MIQINGLKLNISASEEDIKLLAAKKLKLKPSDILSVRYIKRSLDARNKQDIRYLLNICVETADEQNTIKRLHDRDISVYNETEYSFLPTGDKKDSERPVIVGAGPAGLFCAYNLARFGYRPLIIERGGKVEDRIKSVNSFFGSNILDEESNIQFGEGGAGTFSDGKLNTLIRDENGRIKFVYKTFVKNGANEDILWQNKPHIGTDVLREVIISLRKEIEKLGGEFIFNEKLTDLKVAAGRVVSIQTSSGKKIPCSTLVLALGHSARDTFYMLLEKGLLMEQKPFAVGFRVEHTAEEISRSQYGESYLKLPNADYKLTNKCSNGRGCYSFCMCPGGHVVNASSEKGRLAVNGMSFRARDAVNSNSAIAVTVEPSDFSGSHPLAGVEFQRHYEELAYKAGKGVIPIQRYADYKADITGDGPHSIKPTGICEYSPANLNGVLPDFVKASIIESMERFGHLIKGFDRDDALLSGVETRTSSPVRIIRDEVLESSIKGIYPCGEGAGYAGGITSAAVDGLRVSEYIMNRKG